MAMVMPYTGFYKLRLWEQELPRGGGSNKYPQSMFGAKIGEKCITLHIVGFVPSYTDAFFWISEGYKLRTSRSCFILILLRKKCDGFP